MPYILLKTNGGKFPFLVDTGANINIISPELAYRFKHSKPYKLNAKNISSANGRFHVSSAIDINFFSPKIDYTAQFMVHKFHNFFEGIIGTSILNALDAIVDLKNKNLILQLGEQILTIPLESYIPQPQVSNSLTETTPNTTHTNIVESDIDGNDEILSKNILDPSLFRTTHLSDDQNKKLLNVLQKHDSVFHKPNAKLTCSTVVECSINTTDDIPVHQKVYPYPVAYIDEVNKQISKLLNDGIIRPSRSAWTSPVWIVPKKSDASGDKKFRMVIDYRKINEKTVSDRYPMPEINYVLDQLKGQKFFTTLDLASGFHQIRMKESDIEKTAFSINNGKYEFTRMPFGLKNAPAIFQRAIDDVLRQYIGKICYVYIDDVIVFGRTFEEALKNLETIMKALNDANLKIQLDKSEFLHCEIEFLGYVIGSEGIKPNPQKIEAIQKYPPPTTIKELRSFLGMMSYYRRFVKDFARIAKPLTNLLRGENNISSSRKIDLNETETNCFEKMKSLLSSTDILAYPDHSKPYILTTDASDFAIGAVLSQGEIGKDRPIHFASRSLTRAEEKHSVPEKEMLAIYWALKTFRNYLYGSKFKIFTDHQPLTFALSPKNTNAKLKNMKAYLEEHDYQIIYKPGKSNVVADALSRIACSMTGTQHSASDSDDMFIISTEAPINAFKHQIIIKKGPDKIETSHPFPDYTRITIYMNDINENSIFQILNEHVNASKLNGLFSEESIMGKIQEVYRNHFGRQNMLKIRFTQKMLIDIPEEHTQWEIIKKEHYRAHRGLEENKAQILRKFYFPQLNRKLREFTKNCQLCHENKYDRNPIHYPLQKTPIPQAPFQIAHIDIMFLEKLIFLTYIDKFSKFAQVRLIESRAAVDLVPAIKEVLTKYKLPETVVMDNEKSFTTGDLVNFFNENGITPYIVATGRSEMNGVIERFHSTLQEIYRITKAENPNKKPEQLVEMSVIKYNSSVHSCTKYTPFEVIIPSSRSSTIIEAVYKNLQKKQTQDLKNHNKSLSPRHVDQNKIAFEKTRRRMKTVPRYKKINIQKVHNSTVTTTDNRRVHKNDLKIRYD